MASFSCSHCYTTLSPTTTTTFACPGCGDPYCSTACLRRNWKTHHAPWCGLEYGRQGKDWVVQYISDTKGEGVVALRDFRDCERIMVERMIDEDTITDDPAYGAIMERLEPRSGDLKEICRINSVGSNDHRGIFGGVCVNISKVNNGCSPNAFTYYEPRSKTMALISIGSIHTGTEVTISYTEYMNEDTVGGKAAENVHRYVLARQYGITCHSECACRDAQAISRVQQSRRLDKLCQKQILDGKFNDAYVSLKARLDITVHPKVKLGICFDLFNVCNVSGRRAEARGYIKQAHEITASMSYPRSPDARMYLAIGEKSEEKTFYQLKERRTAEQLKVFKE